MAIHSNDSVALLSRIWRILLVISRLTNSVCEVQKNFHNLRVWKGGLQTFVRFSYASENRRGKRQNVQMNNKPKENTEMMQF